MGMKIKDKYHRPCDRCGKWQAYLMRMLAIDASPEPENKPRHEWWCLDCVSAMVAFRVLA